MKAGTTLFPFLKKTPASLALILLTLSGVSHAQPAMPAIETLAIDTQGHPRLRWTPPSGTYSYQVERRSDRNVGGETSCPAGETLNSGWCVLNSVSVAPEASPSTKVVFTDTVIRVDPADPTEYQYRVKTVSGSASSGYSAKWASNCEVVPAHPLATWMSMKSTDNEDILNPTDRVQIVLAATNGTVHLRKLKGGDYYAIWNDLYTAIIGKNGGLVSLVHRQYGIDYILRDFNELKSPSVDSWAMKIKQSGSSSPGTTIYSMSTTPTVTPVTDGYQFTWANAENSGVDVTVTWTLQQAGSSGLHGNIQATRSSSGSIAGGITSLEFPVVRGLGFPFADVFWPVNSTGVTYNNFPYRTLSDPELWFPGTGPGTEVRSLHADFLNGLRMQFFGISRQEGLASGMTMYIGAEDPNQVPKAISFQPNYVIDENLFAAGSGITHYPINGTGQTQSSIGDQGDNYDVVLTPMCGGQERVAKRYRRFALQQSWVKAPASTLIGGTGSTLVNAPTYSRNDLNERVKEGVWWWLHDNGPERSLEKRATYANTTLKGLIGPSDNINVGFHVYNWYFPPFGHNLPDYPENRRLQSPSDTVTTMAGFVAAVQDENTVVMPYINALLMDISDRCSLFDWDCGNIDAYNRCDDPVLGGTRVCGWFERSYLGYVVKNNLLYNEFSTSSYSKDAVQDSRYDDASNTTGTTYATADVDSAFWQAVTSQNADQVFGFGSAGIYLDSFGIGYKPDYADLWSISRSRPRGHGTFYRNGLLALGDTVRAKALLHTSPEMPKHFSAAEHFNEAYIRKVDLFTIYDEHAMEASPLSQLVYSDYALFAGPRARDKDTPQARTMRYGRAFTWGIQLGLTGVSGICDTANTADCENDQNPDVLAYLKTLAKARQKLFNFLSYGEFMGMAEDKSVTLLPEAPEKPGSGWCVTQTCSMVENDPAPTIRAARWISNTQEKAIIMTNTSFESSTVNIPVPPNWRGLATECFDEAEHTDDCIDNTATTTMQVTLPALSVRYITFN